MSSRDDRWIPTVWPDWEPLVPPRELWVGSADPFLHFVRWIWEYRAYLTLLCGLRSDSAVLELGCNHGRTALGLIDYVAPPGRYEGLDILAGEIEFAQGSIQRARPHFRFTHADVRNDAYNPGGALEAATFRFSWADASFDVVYAASLFSHLVPAAAANYLRESRRVLAPGGKCLFSFFVLDFYRGRGSSAHELYEFEHPLPGHAGVAAHDAAAPEALLAYRREAVEAMAAAAGLRVERVLPGYWSKSSPLAVNEQELVLFAAV